MYLSQRRSLFVSVKGFDDSRIRKDNAPENLAIVRQIALNLFHQEKIV
ncbi:MAG: hypothetical protein AB4426_01715 [Xenococcaceae cyanobacterium]